MEQGPQAVHFVFVFVAVVVGGYLERLNQWWQYVPVSCGRVAAEPASGGWGLAFVCSMFCTLSGLSLGAYCASWLTSRQIVVQAQAVIGSRAVGTDATEIPNDSVPLTDRVDRSPLQPEVAHSDEDLDALAASYVSERVLRRRNR